MIPLGIVQGQQSTTIPVAPIVISVNATAVNLRALWDALYPAPTITDDIQFIINSGVALSGTSTQPSLRTGIWPPGVIPTLTNNSIFVRGKGGDGNGPNPGEDGGDAFLVESEFDVDNQGTFAGGGGGGAGSDSHDSFNPPNNSYASGGGGGAGLPPGAGGTAAGAINSANGQAGNLTTGGNAGSFGSDPNQPSLAHGGDGGDLGLPGGDAADVGEPGSEDNVGGAAGNSVNGVSLVNWINIGTLIGPQIN